jgi:hypothetical protein
MDIERAKKLIDMVLVEISPEIERRAADGLDLREHVVQIDYDEESYEVHPRSAVVARLMASDGGAAADRLESLDAGRLTVGFVVASKHGTCYVAARQLVATNEAN